MIPLSPDEAAALEEAFSWLRAFGARPRALASIAKPEPAALHFVDGRSAARPLALPTGALLLHPPKHEPSSGVRAVAVERPRLEFARLTRALLARRTQAVRYEAVNGAWIAEGARLGPGCRIGPGAVIGPDVELGPGVEVMAGAVLLRSVRAGERCRIHPLSRLGVDGYGYGFAADGTAVQIAHLGGVVLGRNVVVGPGSTVCAGTLDASVIGDDVMIDGQVYIGHNVLLKARCQITAGAVIGGSARIGEGALIHPGAMVKTKIEVGDGAVVGIGAAAVKPVAAGETVMGEVAGEIRSRLRREAGLDALLKDKERGR